MRRITILIPVYNDWQSLAKLLIEININIKEINESEFNCIIVNDASTIPAPEIKVPSNLESIELINMKKNKGHARCNAFGIRYLSKKNNYDHVILMDGDGEDRPSEIKFLVEKALIEKNKSVVARRIKRSEGPFFQSLYQLHKIITYLFTGQKINFGNYSCLTFEDVKKLSTKISLWSSFSGSVKNHIDQLSYIDSIRGLRYFGPSQMSLYKLGIHSFSIIAVFKKIVFIRSVLLIIISSYFYNSLGFTLVLFQFLLVTFNLLIYLVSLRENEKDFLDSDFNKESSKIYTH